ncbi:hypothetical protein ACTFIY_008295 [Dictyostelium cf. discoideum]
MSNIKYRSCVGALIFNDQGQVLVCKRASKKKTAVGKWQFPQGGVEAGRDEDYYFAVLREIKEEVGLEVTDDKLRFVSKIEEPLSYLYEYKNSITKAIGKVFNHNGQMIHWHLFFLPKDLISLIDLGFEEKPEFDECKWFNFDDFLNQEEQPNNNDQTLPVPFKKEMYKQLLTLSNPIIEQYLQQQQQQQIKNK